MRQWLRAALVATIVGSGGAVLALEMVQDLVRRAEYLLAGYENVHVVEADAHETTHWHGATKVHCGFAINALPQSWIDALADRGMLIAPVVTESGQILTCSRKRTACRTLARWQMFCTLRIEQPNETGDERRRRSIECMLRVRRLGTHAQAVSGNASRHWHRWHSKFRRAARLPPFERGSHFA